MASDSDFSASLQEYNELLAATLRAARGLAQNPALRAIKEFEKGQQHAINDLIASGRLAGDTEIAYLGQLLRKSNES